MKRFYKPLQLIAGFALAISLFSNSAFAQVGENDTTFNTQDNDSNPYKTANSWIHATASQADNSKFVLGGDFTTYNGENHNRIVRILANGSIDPNFNSGIGLDVTPSSVAVQADNKILVGGSFTSYNGSAVNGFIRINEDGSLDNAFPAASILSNANKIKVQSSGKFFALTNLGLVRLNADGTIDASFANTANYGGSDYAVQPDGKVIIASEGTDTVHLIRLLANGALDPSYKADIAIRINSWSLAVNSIGLQLDGKILIGGTYRTGNSQEIGILKRVNTDGTEDSTFTLDVNPNNIYSINIQPDGKAIVAGNWERDPHGGEHTYVQFIARLNLDGSTDNSFIHNNKYIKSAFSIYATTLLSNGQVLAGGHFEEINTYSINNVALLNSDGTLVGNFNQGPGVNGIVRTTAVQSDQKILIGGQFGNVQFTPRSHIARLLPDGGIDTSFDPGKGTNGTVYAIVVQPDGKIIIGGEFTSYDTDTVKNIVRVNADGSIDYSFQTTVDGIIYSLELQSDNKLIVGGNFSLVNDDDRFSLVRLNADGSIDSGFDRLFPTAETNGNEVRTSLILPNGQIMVGGSFSTNGKYNLVRLNSDGAVDPAFTSSNHLVRDVARQPDGKLVVVGGSPGYWATSATGFVSRVNLDGSIDTTWSRTIGPDIDPFYTVTLLSSGQVLVGGEFGWIPEGVTSYITLFDSTGHVDSSFVGNVDGPVYTTQGVINDKVIIGGSFHNYTSVVRNNIARIYAPNVVPTGIKIHSNSPTFIVYPNPAESFLNAINLKQGSVITIRNITGAVIYSEKVMNDRASINVSNYANGIYFMTEQNKDGISTQRFIVNN